MSSDLDRRWSKGPFAERSLAQATGRLAIVRGNVRWILAFLKRRRQDRRFPILPYDGLQMANAVAVAATASVLLAVLLDPFLPLWPQTLPRPLFNFFRFFTQFGKADWILVGTGLAVIIAFLMEAGTLQRRLRVERAIRLFAAFYVFLAVAISGVIVNLLKYIIGRARPKLFDDSGSFAFDFLSFNADWASFPSGHATTGMAFGVALALLFPRACWLFLCLGFWIAASRPFIGVHYPSDMLVGGLLGSATAWLIARIFARLRLVFGFDEDGRLVRRAGVSGRI